MAKLALRVSYRWNTPCIRANVYVKLIASSGNSIEKIQQYVTMTCETMHCITYTHTHTPHNTDGIEAHVITPASGSKENSPNATQIYQ